MSFLRRLARRSKPQGGFILPRNVANQGLLNWPKCAICMRAVDAYGIENETADHVEIWARCGGVRIDPKTGQGVFGSPLLHPVLKSSMTVKKGPGWSENRFTDIVSRLAFFAPDAASEGREFTQELSQEGVRKKHTV